MPRVGHRASNTPNQPIMTYNTMAQPFQSVSVITILEEAESVVSQWMLRSDGSLELSTRPEPEAKYFLQVCASDENRVRIPVEVAACVPANVQAPLEQC